MSAGAGLGDATAARIADEAEAGEKGQVNASALELRPFTDQTRLQVEVVELVGSEIPTPHCGQGAVCCVESSTSACTRCFVRLMAGQVAVQTF